jgi:hypothetical protein
MSEQSLAERPRSPGVLAGVRRLAGRVARRAFRRQVAINRSVCERLTALEAAPRSLPVDLAPLLARIEVIERRQRAVEDHADQSLALGWDYVALVRRLAWLEDEVERLRSCRDEAAPMPSDDGGARAA